MRRRLVTALTLTLLAALLVPGGAAASSIEVQRDCILDGKIDGTYSQKDYRDALRDLTTYGDEYSNCRDVIQAARLAAAGGSPSTPGTSVPIPAAGVDPLATATPQQRIAVHQAQHNAPASIRVGGQTVELASLGAGRPVKASLSAVPTPLLVAVILALLAGAGALVSMALPRVRRYLDL